MDLIYLSNNIAAAENCGDPGKSEVIKVRNPLEIVQNKLK